MSDNATQAKAKRSPRGPLTGQLKGMLRTKEAADFLGTSESTLAAWRRKQVNVTYYKVGSDIGYKKEDLEKCRKAMFELRRFDPIEPE